MKWIKATELKTQDERDINIVVGNKIKIYGNETTVKGFYLSFNDALDMDKGRWETIILTEGRGDPFGRSLNVIEVTLDQDYISPFEPESPSPALPDTATGKELFEWVKASERLPELPNNSWLIARWLLNDGVQMRSASKFEFEQAVKTMVDLSKLEWLDDNDENKEALRKRYYNIHAKNWDEEMLTKYGDEVESDFRSWYEGYIYRHDKSHIEWLSPVSQPTDAGRYSREDMEGLLKFMEKEMVHFEDGDWYWKADTEGAMPLDRTEIINEFLYTLPASTGFGGNKKLNKYDYK